MKIYILGAAMSLPMLAFAGSGTPIQHIHGERSHTHSLPDSGRNHTHGAKKKPVKSASAHSHGARSHSHILPKSGANHSHSAKQKSQKRKPAKGWTQFANSDESYLDFKNGSYEESMSDDAEYIAAAIFQWSGKVASSVIIERGYITKYDCLKGYGTVHLTDMGGKSRRTADYAKGAKSMGSAIGEVLCSQVTKK